MKQTWIVVADEGQARVLAMQDDGADFAEVETLTEAAARGDAADLRRDAHGRRAGAGTLSSSYPTVSAGEDELHQEADLFARRLAQWLADARRANRFEAVRIAAAPRFLGLLRKALAPEVSACVVEELDKNFGYLNAHELTQRLGAGPGR